MLSEDDLNDSERSSKTFNLILSLINLTKVI